MYAMFDLNPSRSVTVRVLMSLLQWAVPAPDLFTINLFTAHIRSLHGDAWLLKACMGWQRGCYHPDKKAVDFITNAQLCYKQTLTLEASTLLHLSQVMHLTRLPLDGVSPQRNKHLEQGLRWERGDAVVVRCFGTQQ